MRSSFSTDSKLEFESLPPALQRKYFSSAERLRIATDGAPSRGLPHLCRPRPQTPIPKRRSSFFDLVELGVNSQDVGARLKRRLTHKQQPLVSETAAWFTSLPPAVRRKHFSKEEQTFYTVDQRLVILDAADELLGRRCNSQATSEYSAAQLHEPSPVSTQLDDHKSFYIESDTEDDNGHPCHEFDTNTVIGMENFSEDGFRWLDDESELDLQLDDYHQAIAETARRQASILSRPSHTRIPSLSSLSFRRGSISSQPDCAVTRAGPTSALFKTPDSPVSLLTRRQSKLSTSVIDPQATFYQDPKARMKLRLYLASPSKFDEAVEFGFPSLQDRPLTSTSRPKTSPRATSDDIRRTFFTDDTPSLSNDDGDSHDEMEALQDPRTPDEPNFRQCTPIHAGTHRFSSRSQVFRTATDSYAHANTLDREMTIHMTLTRPDLRSLDDTSRSAVNALPIHRTGLPPCDSPATIWDTCPVEESKVRSIWKKLKLG